MLVVYSAALALGILNKLDDLDLKTKLTVIIDLKSPFKPSLQKTELSAYVPCRA